VSKALAHCQVDVECTCVAIKNISLTKDGVVPLDPGCPSFWKAQLGFCGSVLNAAGLIMATDGWSGRTVPWERQWYALKIRSLRGALQ
jgi:hypothetical protein